MSLTFWQRFNHYSNLAIAVAVVGTLATAATLRLASPTGDQTIQADTLPTAIINIEPTAPRPGEVVTLSLASSILTDQVVWTVPELPNFSAIGKVVELTIPADFNDSAITVFATTMVGSQSVQKHQLVTLGRSSP